MTLSRYEYQVLDVTDDLYPATKLTVALLRFGESGWDVQQVFTKRTVEGADRVFVLLQRARDLRAFPG